MSVLLGLNPRRPGGGLKRRDLRPLEKTSVTRKQELEVSGEEGGFSENTENNFKKEVSME